ncbi:MAG: CPBP family intramembrane metalloprotease [Oscillospiraceae bacterium]|nr:CPBP family intramembrane metalloprotease [Oscillospiraceae bacterium]
MVMDAVLRRKLYNPCLLAVVLLVLLFGLAKALLQCLPFAFAAIFEELFFRDFLLKCVLLWDKRCDKRAAILETSLLFGALHLLNLSAGMPVTAVILQSLSAFCFGLWAGKAALDSGSLFPALLVHVGINLLSTYGLPVPALYIDPGTGAMLFAIVTGVLGVLRFALKGYLVKLRFLLSGGKKVETNKDVIPFVIFSDDKRYWPVFEPICRELDMRGFNVTYMSQSPDDPALGNSYKHVHAEFIGEGNKAFAKLNFLKATILLSTTPGLDVYQWKRSKNVKYYVHITHAPSELTTYRMFGTDYYDALLLSGQYQIDDCRALEKLRELPEKECVLVGIPYLDEKVQRLETKETEPHERIVLVAPSWGPNSILNRFGNRLVDQLIATGYHIIIRPHPQSYTSEKELIENLMADYPSLEWNRDTDNFDVLARSDIMISDFSGVIFDFSLVFDKPVICAYTDFDSSQDDACWLDTPIWTATAIPRIGPILCEENLPDIRAMIDAAIEDRSYAESRHEVRDETWMYRGEGAKRAADYLMQKYTGLT